MVRIATCRLFLGVLALAGAPVVLTPVPAGAGAADVVDVRVRSASAGVYAFEVTVRHADTGWDHYANVWEVVAPDGRVLGRRTLLHPHVEEQPFTRNLSGVRIPTGIDRVILRARDSVHGLGGREMTVTLPR